MEDLEEGVVGVDVGGLAGSAEVEVVADDAVVADSLDGRDLAPVADDVVVEDLCLALLLLLLVLAVQLCEDVLRVVARLRLDELVHLRDELALQSSSPVAPSARAPVLARL